MCITSTSSLALTLPRPCRTARAFRAGKSWRESLLGEATESANVSIMLRWMLAWYRLAESWEICFTCFLSSLFFLTTHVMCISWFLIFSFLLVFLSQSLGRSDSNASPVWTWSARQLHNTLGEAGFWEPMCGKAELQLFVGFLCFSTLHHHFTGFSPEFTGITPEYRIGAP